MLNAHQSIGRGRAFFVDQFQPSLPDTPIPWSAATRACISLSPNARMEPITVQLCRPTGTVRIIMLDEIRCSAIWSEDAAAGREKIES